MKSLRQSLKWVTIKWMSTRKGQSYFFNMVRDFNKTALVKFLKYLKKNLLIAQDVCQLLKTSNTWGNIAVKRVLVHLRLSYPEQPFSPHLTLAGQLLMERDHFFTCIMSLVLSCAGLTIPAFQRNSWFPTCKSNTMFLFQFQTKFGRGLMKQTQRLLNIFTTDRLMQSFQISSCIKDTINALVAQRFIPKKGM